MKAAAAANESMRAMKVNQNRHRRQLNNVPKLAVKRMLATNTGDNSLQADHYERPLSPCFVISYFFIVNILIIVSLMVILA